MKLELHLLQNFAPSNLNRDDTGAPKDCEFGGVRRARISSQCLKRAIREAFSVHELLGEKTTEQMAARTKRLVHEAARLATEKGRGLEEAERRAAFALQAAKLKVDEEQKTQYLLYIPRRAVARLATIVDTHWDELAAADAQPAEPAAEGAPKKKAKKSDEKNAAKNAVPKHVAEAITGLFEDASKTPDLALFGRMIADNPDWNTDASCQVAHAISTNRVSMEFDFYTAVDDLKPRDTAGSDMMGTIAFQSACFYRYACLDVDALERNLGGADAKEARELTKKTVEAFLRASALAIPTGKQNSMAAQNLPSYLLAVVRKEGAPQSLANAFVKPVKPSADDGLVDSSVKALEGYLDRTLGMWGDEGVTAVACTDSDVAPSPRAPRVGAFDAWVGKVLEAATTP
jgi:CRISPR system Cascade subunit CasC